MSQIKHFADAVNIPLPPSKPVASPVGEPTSETSSTSIKTEEGVLSGVWSCTPGKWRRAVADQEFCHFIAGNGYFIPDEGDTIEIKPGTAVLFPANCQGTWDVRETIKKTFVIFPN